MDKPMISQEVKDIRRNYTRTPNILFESYPDLHPQEKWLFINLVYLCGARGTRHLSIRYIAQRTGISAGALSGSKDPAKNNPGMLRRLHNAGLIHAEVKKKRNQDGSEKEQAQYHITITDIWQLNEVFFIERSKNEHLGEGEGESVRNMNTYNEQGVHIPNASVQNVNTNCRERSEYERERSDFDTNIKLQNKTTEISKITEQEDIDANASTPAREEPYVPVFDLPQRQAIQELSPVLDEKIEQVDEERIRITAQPSDPAQGVGYEKPSKQSTSQTSSSQRSAKAEPRKPRARSQGKEHTIYFSVEGAAFRAWYEEVFEMQLDETAANARACNALGKRTSVTYENVQLVKREIDLNKWARENNVVPTPQDLAREDGNIRWEKWLQSAQKRAKQPQRAQPKGDNNLADWVAESQQQQAQMSREESARKTEEARQKLAAVQQQIAAQKAMERQKQAVIYRVKGESYA